jgi:uncharacterized RDD family membrane protein YckC
LAGVIDLAVVSGIVAASAWNWGSKVEDGQWVLHGLPALALMAFIPSYWLVVESMFAGTLGKLLLGLRVFSLDGSELELRQVFKRSLAKLLEAPVSFLPSLIVVGSNPLRQSVGDLWARTMVTTDAALEIWRHGSTAPAFDAWLKSFPKAGSGGEASGKPVA